MGWPGGHQHGAGAAPTARQGVAKVRRLLRVGRRGPVLALPYGLAHPGAALWGRCSGVGGGGVSIDAIHPQITTTPTVMSWRARLPDPAEGLETVHDGDTLWLTRDLGDWIRQVWSVRLRDVRAPELDQIGGPECHQSVTDWLTTWNVGRWPYRIDSYKTSGDRDITSITRFVCDVWNANRTSCLNDVIREFVHVNGYPPGRVW